MSIYSNVNEKDLIILRKLVEQQKKQRAPKIENKNLKQTHDIKLAESLSPITKKLVTINESAKKIGEVIKESSSEKENIQNKIRAPPNSNKFSIKMLQNLGALMNS